MGVSTQGARRLCLWPRASSELHPEQSQRSELCVRWEGRSLSRKQPNPRLGDAAVCEPRCVRGTQLIVSLGQETAGDHPDLD